MAEKQKCSRCGAELPSDAPGGHCLPCLLQLGLAADQPAESGQTAIVAPALLEIPGDRIGRYKLLEQIGEGGYGVVYMAEQEEPVRRRVALKVIKLGMDTRAVIARFEAERQALALMDHPNIARVLDAGATDTGRPYFVMELVRGVKITDYCDERKCSTRQRLELFIQVCQAVQHAHQKGVIHRDLKPSNILVTEHDGAPVPKVIDFGVAKATTGQQLTDKTLFTAFRQFIGTPAYTSPEQAGLGGLDIDTRSDIYSLGVLLYELLTGKQPFDSEMLRRSAIDEILHTIREKEPPRPSARLTTLAKHELTAVAQRRQSEPAKLSRLLRGDLDRIVMKVLEKDRTRRYQSAGSLAMDIQRFLNEEPVLARSPTLSYQLEKFVSRNRVLCLAGAAVMVALLAALSISLGMYSREVKVRREAQASETRARKEAIKSDRTREFLENLFHSASPGVIQGQDTTVLRDLLDQAANRVSLELTNEPDIAAQLLLTIGNNYRWLGEFQKAEQVYLQGDRFAASVRALGAEPRASLLEMRGIALTRLGRSGEALILYKQALALRKADPNSNPDAIALSWSFQSVSLDSLHDDPDASERLLGQILALQKKAGGGTNQAAAETLATLSFVLEQKKDIAGAETAARQSLGIYLALYRQTNVPSVAGQLSAIGQFRKLQGDFVEAEQLMRAAAAINRKIYQPGHPDAMPNLIHLADLMAKEDRLQEAEDRLREALAGRDQNNPAWPVFASRAMLVLAGLRARSGDLTEAESLRKTGIALVIGNSVEPHPMDITVALGLADNAQLRDEMPEAEQYYHQAVELARRLHGDDHRQLAEALGRLAAFLRQQERTNEAEPVSRELAALTATNRLPSPGTNSKHP